MNWIMKLIEEFIFQFSFISLSTFASTADLLQSLLSVRIVVGNLPFQQAE